MFGNQTVVHYVDMLLPWSVAALTALVVWIVSQLHGLKIWRAEAQVGLKTISDLHRKLDSVGQWRAKMTSVHESLDTRDRDVSTALSTIERHDHEFVNLRRLLDTVATKIDTNTEAMTAVHVALGALRSDVSEIRKNCVLHYRKVVETETDKFDG